MVVLRTEYENQLRYIRNILQRLENGEQRADFSFYSSLVRDCRGLPEAKRLHSQIIRDGYHHQLVLSNLIIKMYGVCGSIQDARSVFQNLRWRNVYSYNIMIAASAENGHLQEAEVLFKLMPARTDVSWTTMISVYSQRGYWKRAREMFDQVPVQDAIPWNAMITAYAENERCDDALQLFRQLDLSGFPPDIVTIINATNCCATVGCLALGRELHQDIIALNLISDVSVATALLTMYSKCGAIEDAKQMFDTMPEKNVMSWTSMVAAFANKGELSSAVKLFKEAPSRNDVTWNVILTAFLEVGRIYDAVDVFHLFPMWNVVAWNTLMVGFGQSGYLNEANDIFSKMILQNVVSWNVIIGANAQNGCGEAAIDLLKKMDLEGMQANRVTFLSIIEACSCIADLKLARTIHSVIQGMEFEHHYTIETALVAMYARCQGLEEAKRIFDRSSKQDVTLCNSLIYAYTQNGGLDEAKQIFSGMQERNQITWNLILTGNVKHSLLDEAKLVFEAMPKDVISKNTMLQGYSDVLLVSEAEAIFNSIEDKNIVSWNTMIATYAQSGACPRASYLFRLLDMEGLSPNCFTYVAVLEAISGLSSLRETRIIHRELAETRFMAETNVATALVSVYGKCGGLREAKQVFDAIRAKNMVSWNAMMTSYAQNGMNSRALEYFSLLQQSGFEPDSITYITAMAACSHGGFVEHARRYFVAMQEDYSIQPNADHFGCMIDLLGRAGRVETAEELMLQMPLEPDASNWTSLLSSCTIHGDARIGSGAGGRIMAMKAREAGPYMLMANIFSLAGDSEIEKLDMEQFQGEELAVVG